MSEKPTNPKDIIGSGKLPLELVPDTAVAYMALSFLEGALKYGRFNWRVAGVRASIYAAAARRHLNKWWNGEDEDPKTKVHHLASVMACCAIVLDAKLVGKLTDDRPPRADMGKLIESLEATTAHLKQLFAGHSPKQYTIADSVPGQFTVVGIDRPLAGQRAGGIVIDDPVSDPTATARRLTIESELRNFMRDGKTDAIVPAVREPAKVSGLKPCLRCGVGTGWRHSPDCPIAYG